MFSDLVWEVPTGIDIVEFCVDFSCDIPDIPNECLFSQDNCVSEQDITSRVELFSCELDDIPTQVDDCRGTRIKKNRNSYIHHCSVYHLSPGCLEGSHFSQFLASFVVHGQQHRLFHFVDIEKIQRIVFYDFRGLNGPDNMQTSLTEKASLAYVFAAVGIGALTENLFCSSLMERNYQRMKNALKGCFGVESEEVIFAHLAISQFCRLTGRSHEYKKHSGFARVLMNVCGNSVSDRIKKTFSSVILGYEMASVKGFEAVVIDSICSTASISSEDFALKFPCLHAYQMWKKQALRISITTHQLTEEIEAMKEFLTTNVNIVVEVTMCVAIPGYIREIVTSAKLLNCDKAKALQEFLGFLQALLVCSGHFPSNMSATAKTMACFSHMCFSFFSGDFVAAKALLQLLVRDIEPYWLCFWLEYESKHMFHLIIVMLSSLEMHSEFHVFKEKLNSMLEFLGQPQINEHFPPDGPAVFHSTCEHNCFSSIWASALEKIVKK